MLCFFVYITMKLKLKEECVDIFISCPFTGQIINTVFLEIELYQAYKDRGYDIFQVEETEEEKPLEVKTKNK